VDSPSIPSRRAIAALERIYGRRIEANPAATDAEPERLCSDADPDCPYCYGHGFVRRAAPTTHPDFGKAFVCSCAAPKLRARRIARMEARIPQVKPGVPYLFETYPAEGDQAALARARAYADADTGSLFLWGRVRTGKTSLAASIAHERILRGDDVLFVTVPDLLEQLRRSFDHEEGELSTGQITDLVKQATLVVLDDIGAEKVSEWVADVLYRLINHRQSLHLRTVYTSNKSLVELEARLGDRIAWRIKAHCEGGIVKVAGQNLNDREAA
jgi:DNA replication protein DnaC